MRSLSQKTTKKAKRNCHKEEQKNKSEEEASGKEGERKLGGENRVERKEGSFEQTIFEKGLDSALQLLTENHVTFDVVVC